MKKLLVLTMLVFASVASAARINCEYQEEACDEAGNHYHCYAYGWSNAEYCYATDMSYHPPRFFTSSTQEKVEEGANLACDFRPEVCGLNSEYCVEKDRPQLNYCRRVE